MVQAQSHHRRLGRGARRTETGRAGIAQDLPHDGESYQHLENILSSLLLTSDAMERPAGERPQVGMDRGSPLVQRRECNNCNGCYRVECVEAEHHSGVSNCLYKNASKLANCPNQHKAFCADAMQTSMGDLRVKRIDAMHHL